MWRSIGKGTTLSPNWFWVIPKTVKTSKNFENFFFTDFRSLRTPIPSDASSEVQTCHHECVKACCYLSHQPIFLLSNLLSTLFGSRDGVMCDVSVFFLIIYLIIHSRKFVSLYLILTKILYAQNQQIGFIRLQNFKHSPWNASLKEKLISIRSLERFKFLTRNWSENITYCMSLFFCTIMTAVSFLYSE